MAKISVAMAVYNGERFLPEQLDSILIQLNPEDELVISYDTSSDGTWDLLQSYKERYSQIKILENCVPGITGNFNNAFSACSGDYVFISDQDDRWAKDKRACVLESFETSGADMVIHNGVHIDSTGEVISKPFFTIHRIGNGKIRNLIKPRYSGCCMAFTRDMANKILPIPAKIDAYDHWVGTIGEFMGQIAYDDRVLLYHRLHDNNVTPVSSRPFSTILKARYSLLKELWRRTNRERRQ